MHPLHKIFWPLRCEPHRKCVADLDDKLDDLQNGRSAHANAKRQYINKLTSEMVIVISRLRVAR